MAQANQELKNQNQQLNVQLLAMEQNNRNALLVAQMDNQTELQKEAMKLEAQAENQNANRVMVLEKEAFKQNNENARMVAKIQQKNNEQILNQLGV